MSAPDSSCILESLNQACASIISTALRCRTPNARAKDNPLASAIVIGQILREKEIANWIDQRILEQERLKLKQGSSAATQADPLDVDDAQRNLMETSACLQLEHTYLTRMAMARALQTISTPAKFGSSAEDARMLRLQVLRLRNQLVERTLAHSRQLSHTRQLIQQMNRQLHKLRHDCRSAWSDMERNKNGSSLNTVAHVGDGEFWTANLRTKRKENQIIDLVITDLLAGCRLGAVSDERLDNIIALRIDKE